MKTLPFSRSFTWPLSICAWLVAICRTGSVFMVHETFIYSGHGWVIWCIPRMHELPAYICLFLSFTKNASYYDCSIKIMLDKENTVFSECKHVVWFYAWNNTLAVNPNSHCFLIKSIQFWLLFNIHSRNIHARTRKVVCILITDF